MADYKSLGLVPIPEHTIEHDFAMLTKFQEFSAELLRLALLGISAIALAVSKWLFSKSDEMTLAAAHLAVARPWLILALVAFSIAAFAALYHRYASADSMSWHLQAMRRFQSGEPEVSIARLSSDFPTRTQHHYSNCVLRSGHIERMPRFFDVQVNGSTRQAIFRGFRSSSTC
jgi:hypothetical protein